MRLEHLDDGTKLEAAWNDTLSSSLSYFRALLSSSGSSAWKPVQVLPLTASTTARDQGQSKSQGSSLGRCTASDVVVHRRSGKSGEVYRAVVEVDCGSDVGVDTFRGCLATPETRPIWDRMVEEAMTLDLLDANTRVTKTNYRLGWPSSPRDAVTISKTLVDQHTLIDITTSLPRSRHEPAYLRPAPPYVRAHVALLAWCIQLPSSSTSESSPPAGKARITCMWCWNPKGAWAVGGGVPQHLPSVVVGLVDYVRDGSEKVPVLLGYGADVSIGSVGYDTARVTLGVGYAIVTDGETGGADGHRRQVEFGISSTQSWDVQIQVKTQHGEESPSTVWTSFVGQAPPSSTGSPAPKRLVLRFAHARLQPTEELLRVKVSIERTSSSNSSGVRINGIPVAVEPMEPQANRRPLLEETASTSGVSLRTMSTMDSFASHEGSIDIKQAGSGRNQAAERSIAGLIKRNYIYFTSLLQEPEPKWRPVLDSRGVAVHQLNSIDKTLVVFRAEAVFVGVGIWDLFATIANPGGRLVWDKTHEDANLVEDVNELTDLWHFKSKAAWPVAARDSVMLRTTYKSPSSVHIFGFSVDDTDLFPRIPPSIDPTVIRTQIDLQGWSVESLSPNTTQVTLLEQSDPRGWSNKSSIPQVMMTTLAGIGEFAIKHGAPPTTTRLGGAKAVSSKYDVEKETFRFEYEAAETRRSDSSSTATAFPLPVALRSVKEGNGSDDGSLHSLDASSKPPAGNIECEIRCDADKWANNFSIVIDPPHTAISALRRHRLSPAGGGLWLTIEHDAATLGKDKVAITIRRGISTPGTTKTVVTANGHKVKVDVGDLTEADVQTLRKQKRTQPMRVPLDHPPALGTLRKKKSTMEIVPTAVATTVDPFKTVTPTAYTRLALPLARWYNTAAETTRAAIVPMATPAPAPLPGSTPVSAAIRALSQLSRMHADRESESTDPFGWQPVSDRDGLKVERRVVPHVSESFPVFRAGRIIEGFTAEEVSAAVSAMGKDDRFDRPVHLQSYGHGITTSHVVAHTTFPFRGRSILLATVVARVPDGPPPSPSVGANPSLSTIFHASSSSFDALTLDFDATKYNPTVLPTGNVILEGWIIETIDPYSHEQYAIPSSRCMYVAAMDYSGSMPLSVNNMLNASLPRALLTVESTLKFIGPPSRAKLPPMSVLVPDPAAQAPWALEGVDDHRLGVEDRSDGGEFSMMVTIQPTAGQMRDGDLLQPGLRHADSRTSMNSGRSTVVDLAEDFRGGRKDLAILEVDIGNSAVVAGAEIMLRAISLPVAQHSSSSDPVLPLKLPNQDLDLPFKCTVVALAPSVLQSASLDPSPRARHLLRVTLPTSEYETPISDPLSGMTSPLPRPRWLLDLINDGAVVELRMRTRAEGPAKYTFGGEELVPEDEKRVRVAFDAARNKVPQLVSASTTGSVSLERPLAVAREYMPDALVPVVETAQVNGSSEEQPAAEPEVANGHAEVKATSELAPGPISSENPARYSFWKYSRLPRFAASAPPSADHSPVKQNVMPLAPESDAPPTLPAAVSVETGPTVALLQPTVSPAGLLVACLACLLLGSLLRSLLSDADFVIRLPAGKIVPPSEDLRELKRLFQWRIGWDRDLIIAIARRG